MRDERDVPGIAEDGVEWPVSDDGQDWLVSWHPPPEPPAGTPHGSGAVCVSDGRVVLVTSDGERWGLPGGRPEPGEDWAAVLRREIAEEACATVLGARLLGYGRGRCVRGREAGRALVRAHWRAEVRLEPWRPEYEMTGRRLVPAAGALAAMWIEDGFAPLYRRMFAEARAAGNCQGVLPDSGA
ncbi:MAG: NUDIX domain-containing protein [Mycobacteriales bacterium]